MTLLIYSGLLYLFGISIVLILKPNIMFSKDGNWKEFGLGKNKEKYTWIPFWLFAILWAILSYVFILIIASNTGIGGITSKIDIPIDNNAIEPENISYKSLNNSMSSRRKITDTGDMKSGYYILDTNETMKRGIPKYIFLGPEAPNLVYRNSIDE